LFTHKSVPVIFEPPCISHLGHWAYLVQRKLYTLFRNNFQNVILLCYVHIQLYFFFSTGGAPECNISQLPCLAQENSEWTLL